MTGIFLTVWDRTWKTNAADALQPTQGGYPHITVVYTGKSLSEEDLNSFACESFRECGLRPVELSDPYVNSFIKENGEYRHDILLKTDSDTQEFVESLRTYFKQRFSGLKEDDYSMHPLHVTAKICKTEEEAESYRTEISSRLPLKVSITGITID